jgi:hypothetical protein
MDGKSGVVLRTRTVLIGEGTVVGVRALRLVHVLGYREIHLFGLDCSFRDGVSHAYAQPENDADMPRDCVVGEEKFVSTAWMIRQAEDLQNLSVSLMGAGALIGVHGVRPFPHDDPPNGDRKQRAGSGTGRSPLADDAVLRPSHLSAGL